MESPLTTSLIDYQSFEDERLPKVGVYYIFPRFIDKGICHEFTLDLNDLRETGDETIYSGFKYPFITEQRVITYLERHQFQAIRTQLPDNISFNQTAEIIAQIHFREFLKRHQWINQIN